jgi:hypothetical protein
MVALGRRIIDAGPFAQVLATGVQESKQPEQTPPETHVPVPAVQVEFCQA